MLTRTRLTSLADAACDMAPRGLTFGDLLAAVGGANAEWLEGWLRGQLRSRSLVVAQGRYFRPRAVMATRDRVSATPRKRNGDDLKAANRKRLEASHARFRQVLAFIEDGGTVEGLVRLFKFEGRNARYNARRVLRQANAWKAKQ